MLNITDAGVAAIQALAWECETAADSWWLEGVLRDAASRQFDIGMRHRDDDAEYSASAMKLWRGLTDLADAVQTIEEMRGLK